MSNAAVERPLDHGSASVHSAGEAFHSRAVAIIPAHNEEAVIADAIAALQTQTRPLDRIIVVADKCTDDTANVARAAGVEVLVVTDNTGKKAGALNRALETALSDPDVHIVTMDADTIIVPTWVEDAIAVLAEHPDAGAVAGFHRARDGKGLISLLQRIEYHQTTRRISRRGGHVRVLSGTATMFRPGVLKELLAQRGFVFDERSRVEDLEVTLALRVNGYRPRTFKQLVSTTDVMETWSALTQQRLRWQHGTLETLIRYGWREHTRSLWLQQIMVYSTTALPFLIVFAWGLTIYIGVVPEPLWLMIIPVFIFSQFVQTRRSGFRATVVAMLLIPQWFYEIFMLCVYWVAASRVLRQRDTVW